MEKVKADTSLQEKLQAAKSPEDDVAIAKEHSYDFGASTSANSVKRSWRVYLVAHLLPPLTPLTPRRDAMYLLATERLPALDIN